MSGIVRLGGAVPKTLIEWTRVFRKLNEAMQVTEAGVEVTADNLPRREASYVTLANNTSLPNDRALVSLPGHTVIQDGGSGGAVTVKLDEKGDAGTYAKVVTDKYGRVVAGANLLRSDMPQPLDRFYQGTGTPNGVLSETPGAIYINIAGGAGTTLWVKQSGSGNTGWVGK